MKKVFESLKNYFENTPSEQIEKDWEELKKYNEIGPDIEEFLFVQKQFAKDMENQNNREISENKEKERERVLRLLKAAENDVEYFRHRLEELDKRNMDSLMESKILEAYPFLGQYFKSGNTYGYIADIECNKNDNHICGITGPHFDIGETNSKFSCTKNINSGTFINLKVVDMQFITKEEFEEKLDLYIKDVSNRMKENCKVVEHPIFLKQCDSEKVVELRERFKKDFTDER